MGKATRERTTTSGTSLTVNVDLTVQLKSHGVTTIDVLPSRHPSRIVRVTTINLLPSGHPSGVVALKTVHDGHSVTIGSQRFTKLNDPG